MKQVKIDFRSALGFVVDAIIDVFAPKPSPSEATSGQRAEQRGEPRVPAAEAAATIRWQKPDGEFSALEIEITDTSSKGLGIQLPDKIPVGQTVTVSAPEDKKYRGVLQYCRPQDGGYFAGVGLVFRERRRSDREPLAGEGTLSWVDPTGARTEEQVWVQNLTEEGIQLEVPREVPVPSMVRLTGAQEEYFGSTCYCVPDGDKYLVGLHLGQQMGTELFRSVEAEMYLGRDKISGYGQRS